MLLWWIANALILFVVVPVVVLLANRVIRPAVEIQAYSDDILEHGVNLTEHLVPVPALVDTDASIGEITGERCATWLPCDEWSDKCLLQRSSPSSCSLF